MGEVEWTKTNAAELWVIGEPSTGAANDLERAAELARRMVTESGMIEALGPVRCAPTPGFGCLQTQVGLRQEISPETAALVDRETRRLVDEAQNEVLDVLRSHEAPLCKLARVLQENKVIGSDDIARIVEEKNE